MYPNETAIESDSSSFAACADALWATVAARVAAGSVARKVRRVVMVSPVDSGEGCIDSPVTACAIGAA